MELSASSVLFFDELKIFRQIATSIIFIFIENFESSSSDLFQYKFQIFSSKRSTTNFKRIFFDLRWVQEVQSFAPLIEERPGCHHRIAGWPRILRSWEKSEVKEKCNMSKLDLKSKFFDPTDVFKGHWCHAAAPFMNLKHTGNPFYYIPKLKVNSSWTIERDVNFINGDCGQRSRRINGVIWN